MTLQVDFRSGKKRDAAKSGKPKGAGQTVSNALKGYSLDPAGDRGHDEHLQREKPVLERRENLEKPQKRRKLTPAAAGISSGISSCTRSPHDLWTNFQI